VAVAAAPVELVAPVIEEGKLRAFFRPAGRVTFVLALTIAALAGTEVPSQGGSSATADSLVLQQPDSFRVWSVYNPNRRQFVVWMTFNNPPDSCATYLHEPDTTSWTQGLPQGTVATPTVQGTYTGDVDRSLRFVASDSGAVGTGRPLDGRLRLEFEIRGEEWYSGRLDVGSGYTPGDWQRVLFDDTRTTPTEQIYFGVDIAFSPGVVGVGREFRVGMEDFEGFHLWRGIEPDGSDLTVIGEVSKQEAFRSGGPGGDFVDSVYFYQIIPDLRQNGIWYSPYGAVQCLGTRIDLDLDDNEMFWFDCNAFNGFTYYYAVTSFDRGYSVSSGRQGLTKFDNCAITEGVPYECADQLQSISMEVDSQDEMYRIYVVPNPYRTGGSRLTTENYHNFPDGKVRFVNMPANADLKVYTIAGDLVWEYYHSGPLGNVDWDTANLSGELIASGVYIFRVESASGGSMYGRFVVIR
jgi:hypothetical protein